MIDLQDLLAVAVELRVRNPRAPVATVLDAAMLAPPGGRLKSQTPDWVEVRWLGPRGPFAKLLREALGAELEEEFGQLLDDPEPEVRQVFWGLWEQTVVRRFCERYFGWGDADIDLFALRFRTELAAPDLRKADDPGLAAAEQQAA